MISFDSELYGIIFLSLRVTITAVIFSSIIGVPLGVLIGLNEFFGKKIIMNIVNTFMSLPPVVAGLFVYILLSNQTGFFGEYRLLFTPTAMIIAQVVLGTPLATGLTITAVNGVSKTIRLSAISLGASQKDLLFTVIREARFGIYASFIAVFGRLIAEVGAVMMVGGNIRYETRVITTAIAMQKGMGEFQTAMALGMILLIISFCVTGCVEMIKNRGRTI